VAVDLIMPERQVRGFGKQVGRVAHLRGPLLFCRRADGSLTPFADPAGVTTYVASDGSTAAVTDKLLCASKNSLAGCYRTE
jgi:hypothetical protein